MKHQLFLLFLIPLASFSQLSAKVDSLYNVINATDQVRNELIGTVGSITYPDYDNLYIKLDSIATDDELLYLAKKGNKTIKYQINQILVDRKSKHLAEVFRQYIFDDQEINIAGGCMAWSSSFAASLYSEVDSQNSKIESIRYNKENYTPEELKKYSYLPAETKWTKPEVDSLLTVLNKIALSNNNILPITLERIFRSNDYRFENYKRIRYFARKYPEEAILATLASFRNKKDLPLLHQNFDKAYIAISKFPDKSFIPKLKDRVNKGWDNYYPFLDAATAFCSKDAEELLTMIVAMFDSMRDSNKELGMGNSELFGHFYECLEKNNCDSNNDFLIKLWTENRTISYSFFLKIKDKHYNEILKGYLNPLPFDSGPINENFDWEKYKADFEASDGYLCPIILNYLKSNSSLNKDKAIDIDKIECKG